MLGTGISPFSRKSEKGHVSGDSGQTQIKVSFVKKTFIRGIGLYCSSGIKIHLHSCIKVIQRQLMMQLFAMLSVNKDKFPTLPMFLYSLTCQGQHVPSFPLNAC